jgi:hypothetical protein
MHLFSIDFFMRTPIIKDIDLGIKGKKRKFIKALVHQFSTEEYDWELKKGLYYPKNLKKFWDKINNVLIKGENENVNLIVFPELSVPKLFVDRIIKWSYNKEIVIIAGTHYHVDNKIKISRCPIIFRGTVRYNEKYVIPRIERPQIQDQGIKPGRVTYRFKNSPFGNFGVLICSEYLDENYKNKYLKKWLRFLIVISFQNRSEIYHTKMDNDCFDNKISYVIYANNRCSSNRNKEILADGKTAFYGDTHEGTITKFKDNGYSNFQPRKKLIELSDANDSYILSADTISTRPFQHGTILDTDNIKDAYLLNINKNIKIVKSNNSLNKRNNQITSNRTKFEISYAVRFQPNSIKNNQSYVRLDKSDYKCIEDHLNDILYKSKTKNLFSKTLTEGIMDDLDQLSISLIIAPILYGKTFFLNKFFEQIKGSAKHLRKIECQVINAQKMNIKSNKDLYFLWQYYIIDEIRSQSGKSFQKINEFASRLINNKDEYLKYLEIRKNISTPSYLPSFLSILNEIKDYINGEDYIIIMFHLDDVQEYISNKVFSLLRDDIIGLSDSFSDMSNSKIKLIISSRHFPSNLPKKIVKFLPQDNFLNIPQLTNLLLNKELDRYKQNDLNELIFEYTDGYPWFVIRFFKIYLKLRINSYSEEPLKLAKYIFDKKEFWINDKILGKEEGSDFLKRITNLINKFLRNNIDSIYIFQSFINQPSSKTRLLNYDYSKNELIKQSGFYKYSKNDSDFFDNNGCKIIKKHFIKHVSQQINEYINE